LLAELADNDCWATLKVLADQAGEEAMAGSFAAALAEEQDHLMHVRTWLAAAQRRVPG
jgi:hypothetical protein